MKRLPILLAVLLAGCATAPNDEPRIGLIVGVTVAALVLAGRSGSDDSEDPGGQNCRIVISPNPGGGLGTSTRVCD